MDDISTRAIVIGINIFVTLTIVSLVIISFFQMREIYGIVGALDTSIASKFDNVYSIYHGKQVSGIGLLNTLKKYEEEQDENIVINYTDSITIRENLAKLNENKVEEERLREATYLKQLMQDGKEYKYEDKYNSTVYTDEEGIIIIDFQKIIKSSE